MTSKPMLSVELRALLERVATEADHMLGFTYASNYDECRKAVDELRALLDKPACVKCGDTGVVDDGELTHSAGGIPYECGPIKCVTDCPDCKPAAQHQGEPVALQHMAVSEGGVLRWMTGRKMQDCELYAMPDGSAIRSNLYAEQPAPVADHTQCEECKGWGYHENHHEGGGTECGECSGSGKAPVEQFSADTVVCRRYQLEQHPGQNFYHYDLEPVYGSVPVTVSDLITMVESAPVAVVMPERREPSLSNPHLSDADHEYNSALDDVARLNGVKP